MQHERRGWITVGTAQIQKLGPVARGPLRAICVQQPLLHTWRCTEHDNVKGCWRSRGLDPQLPHRPGEREWKGEPIKCLSRGIAKGTKWHSRREVPLPSTQWHLGSWWER